MASGHVNRANRPNTWPQPTNCTVKKTLASREPSTHGTTRPSGFQRLRSALLSGHVVVKAPERIVPIDDYWRSPRHSGENPFYEVGPLSFGTTQRTRRVGM
jgi:hypothetical protein